MSPRDCQTHPPVPLALLTGVGVTLGVPGDDRKPAGANPAWTALLPRAPGRKDGTPWCLWHHGECKSGLAKSLRMAPSLSFKALGMYQLTRKLREAQGTLHPCKTALQRLILLVTVTSSFHRDSQETGTLHLIHNFQDRISFSQIQNGNNCFH